jgi:hypothetical protein
VAPHPFEGGAVLHPIEGGVAAHPFERGAAALPCERGAAARPSVGAGAAYPFEGGMAAHPFEGGAAARPFVGAAAAYPFEGGVAARPFEDMAPHPFDTGSDTARLRDLAQPVGGPAPSLGLALLPPRYSHAEDPAGTTARGTSASTVALGGSGTRWR